MFGAMLGCLDPVLTVAAALAHGRPVFLSAPPDAQADLERARSAVLRPALDARSDHVALVAAFNGWAKAKSKGQLWGKSPSLGVRGSPLVLDS